MGCAEFVMEPGEELGREPGTPAFQPPAVTRFRPELVEDWSWAQNPARLVPGPLGEAGKAPAGH